MYWYWQTSFSLEQSQSWWRWCIICQSIQSLFLKTTRISFPHQTFSRSIGFWILKKSKHGSTKQSMTPTNSGVKLEMLWNKLQTPWPSKHKKLYANFFFQTIKTFSLRHFLTIFLINFSNQQADRIAKEEKEWQPYCGQRFVFFFEIF